MRSGHEFGEYGRSRRGRPDRDPGTASRRVPQQGRGHRGPAPFPGLAQQAARDAAADHRPGAPGAGHGHAHADRILGMLGDPVTLVDAEVQRDPEYQQALATRLSRSTPSVPPAGHVDRGRQAARPGRPCATAGPPGPAARLRPGDLPGPRPVRDGLRVPPGDGRRARRGRGGRRRRSAAERSGGPVRILRGGRRPAARLWAGGVRVHPVETVAILLLLVGAVLGKWIVLLAAAWWPSHPVLQPGREVGAAGRRAGLSPSCCSASGSGCTTHGKPGGTSNELGRPAERRGLLLRPAAPDDRTARRDVPGLAAGPRRHPGVLNPPEDAVGASSAARTAGPRRFAAIRTRRCPPGAATAPSVRDGGSGAGSVRGSTRAAGATRRTAAPPCAPPCPDTPSGPVPRRARARRRAPPRPDRAGRSRRPAAAAPGSPRSGPTRRASSPTPRAEARGQRERHGTAVAGTADLAAAVGAHEQQRPSRAPQARRAGRPEGGGSRAVR